MVNKAIACALFFSFVAALFASSYAQQACGRQAFNNNKVYRTCTDLSVLNSFLHWNYDTSTNTVDLAFRHTTTSSSRWVSWALNPSGQKMAGSQCLVAFQNSTGRPVAYTTPIGSGSPTLQPGRLSFQVPNISATLEGNQWTIFATLQLTTDLLSTNQVWQEGPMNGDTPGAHAMSGDNLRSVGTIDFRTGQTTAGGGSSDSRRRRRNTHGVLNAVSWGVLMPMGAMIARYLKVFKTANPAWFYLHVACQASGYIVGVAGWGTGIKLGNDSPGIKYNKHRNIGIALFAIGTLQMFAMLLRPKPDHKYRLYWNIYHWSLGYSVIVLSIINIFEGFDILDPEKKWKRAYIGILIFLGAVAALLEAITWVIVLKRKNGNSVKHHHSINGANGANGYGARTQQGA